MVTWKLRDYLDRHEVSAYALSKSTNLAPSTVYALARGDQRRVDLEVLDKVLAALEQLTGQTVTFNDLLERDIQNGSNMGEDSEYEFANNEVPDDILERIRRFEAGETTGKTIDEIAAKYGVER